jgi:membrane-associated phospholipid phosphatase
VAHASKLVLAFFIALTMSGCIATGARNWGAEVTWKPTARQLKEAIRDAATDPHVWIPLAGAAAFQIDGWDRKVSNWARDTTPVFGSQQNASDWSDTLRTASSVAYFTTVLATPDPHEPGPWLRDKAQGLAVGLGAIAVTGAATGALKSITSRTRPNGEGTNSFPSGHTSHSAVLTGLARDNLNYMDLNPALRQTLGIGLDALTIGTAWARIEAGAHFPSDTLAGFALGNFVSRVFDRAFLSMPADGSAAVSFVPLDHGAQLEWEIHF